MSNAPHIKLAEPPNLHLDVCSRPTPQVSASIFWICVVPPRHIVGGAFGRPPSDGRWRVVGPVVLWLPVMPTSPQIPTEPFVSDHMFLLADSIPEAVAM